MFFDFLETGLMTLSTINNGLIAFRGGSLKQLLSKIKKFFTNKEEEPEKPKEP